MRDFKNIKFVMYLRKSTDSEDHQIQSIEDQKRELNKLVSQHSLNVVYIFQESRSAKKPGRLEFNKMLDYIRQGRASGILCWKANRLSRNPEDGGKIQMMLQDEVIKSILTPHREYLPEDNSLILAVELGIATQFSRDLAKDVKRGLISKAEKGWRPGLAPVGYLNDKFQEKGNKKILVDKEKFPLVRKMWELMLTGNHTVPQIGEIVNEKWGLRTTYHKRQGKLSLSHIYRIFTNTFYFGEYAYAGIVYQGQHKPMITPEEYDRVQKILGKKGQPRSKTKNLPLNGVIRCGECGCSITADEKIKYVKSENKYKSYIYHRCTKRKPAAKCQQKPISHEELKRQVVKILDKITFPERYLDFALNILNRENEAEVANRNISIKNLQKSFDNCLKKIDTLIKIYISPENIKRDLLSDEEFKNQKSSLLKDKAGIQSELKNLDERVDEWIDLTERTFKFATYAPFWFAVGDYETKTGILRALGSNLILKDQKFELSLQKQFEIIQNGLEKIKVEYPVLEPSNFSIEKTKTAPSRAVSDIVSG